MKCEVKLFVAGTVFTEQVNARNYDEASMPEHYTKKVLMVL